MSDFISRRWLISGALAAFAYEALPKRVYSFGAAYQTIKLGPYEVLMHARFERPVLIEIHGGALYGCHLRGGGTIAAYGARSVAQNCIVNGPAFPGRAGLEIHFQSEGAA